MKLNAKQVSELLQINKETLRLYRNQKLINPKRNLDNDYFMYDENDLYTLMFIRRLRGHDVPLKNIYNLINHEEDLVQEDFFDDEIAKNIIQQEELKKKLRGLIACKEHFAMCNDNIGVVKEMYFNDTKYDIPIDEFIVNSSKESREWTKQIELLTLSLSIDKIYLNDKSEKIPYKFTLGLYEQQRKEFNLPLVGSENIFTKGLYLTSIVKISLKRNLEYELIKPLVDYANEKGMTFTSGTTAFLIKIDYSKDNPVYYFRIRVKIEA